MLAPTQGPLPSRWSPRVPTLHRIVDGSRYGPHAFRRVSEGWRLRGKDLGFDTGGLNLDTAIGLQLAAGARARVAADFLSLPIGRDMMLWNVILGARGLYAIDQEGKTYDEGGANGGVPWAARVWPYCLSVRDCYERALGALCGRARPTQPLAECFAVLTRANGCPDAAKPFPCLNGCMPSFLHCERRRPDAALVVERNLKRPLEGRAKPRRQEHATPR